MTRRTTLPWMLVFFALMAAAALACNLTEQPPPTLPPRPSPTPPPTIGYTPLAPNQLPEEASTTQPQSNMFSLLNEIDTNLLMGHVQTLQGFGTRHFASPYDQSYFGVGAARDYIYAQFEDIYRQSQGNFQVSPPQPFNFDYNGQGYTGYNLIGILNGTEAGAGVLVIGAHYDSLSLDFQNSVANAPSANDNGSGVAALIEIARVMSLRPHRQTLVFVAFGAEEIGRRGSIAFVRDYVQAYNLPMIGMINLDIIGSSTGPDGQYNNRQIRLYSTGPNESPSRQLARTLDLLDVIYAPDMDIVIEDAEDRVNRYSDHMSFSEVGYPAVRFIEAIENRDRQHNSSDVSSAIQPEYLTSATRAILGCITALADGPRSPVNISLRINGDSTQTLFWDPVPGAVSYLVVLRTPGSLEYNDWFEMNETSTVWDGFVPTRYESIAIASRDANGLLGPFSSEYRIP